MKTPPRLMPLLEDGLIDEVIGSLKSGKEASVYLVVSRGQVCCAKVYKDAKQRSFKQATLYQESRKVKNSRQARAMAKGSRYGRQEQEEAWQNAEVAALYRLQAAGVRVPQPHGFYDGVLLMDMIRGADGGVAPRLNDLHELSPEQARDYHAQLIREIVRMLCAGLVHGDLSEYNVLMDAQGPVIIDLPQAVDAAGNNHARMMFERDVNNMKQYFGQFAPDLKSSRYGPEIWALYESGELKPDSELSGQYTDDEAPADIDSVLREIFDALAEQERRQALADADGQD